MGIFKSFRGRSKTKEKKTTTDLESSNPQAPEQSARQQESVGDGAPGVSQSLEVKDTTKTSDEDSADGLFGLRIIERKSPPSPAQGSIRYPVDIVAIHGITGTAFSTFTADNGVFWLRDFLLDDLPGARVYSYGYDAGVFFTKAKGTLDDFALALLVDLKFKRTGSNQKRPLIFVCHSMGGLVAKRAINVATLHPDLYPNIADSCYGIAFLSTPHRGSQVTPFPKLLAGVANLATPVLSRFVGASRSDLIKMLEKDSEELAKLSSDFVSRLSKIKVASFIEQKATPPADTRIVDNSTGVIGTPGEQQIPMQGCDHRSVCAFRKRETPYNYVYGVLEAWSKEATGAVEGGDLTDQQLGCLKSLTYPEMNFRSNQLMGGPSGVPSSCEWIFIDPTYLAWINRPQGPLWIKGKPGAGKSTMVQFLVEHFEGRKKNEQLVVLSFFFDAFATQNLNKSPLGLYQTLLSQLLRQAPLAMNPFVEFCQDRWRSSPDQSTAWFEEEKPLLQQQLTEAFREWDQSLQIIIFVDALDEAVQGSGNDIAKYLFQVDGLLRRAHVNVRTCVSCRHFPVLDAPQKHEIFMELRNQQDIRTFIEGKLNVNNTNIVLADRYEQSGFLQTLQAAIQQRSYGMFMWVSLIMPFVIKKLNEAPANTSVILEALDKLEVQTALGGKYTDILNHVIAIDHRVDAYMLLKWATEAKDDVLSLNDMISQVRFSDAYTVDPSELETEIPAIEYRIGYLSGGLMEVVEQENGKFARFIHPSVKKFLFTDGLERFNQLMNQRSLPQQTALDPSSLASMSTLTASTDPRRADSKEPSAGETLIRLLREIHALSIGEDSFSDPVTRHDRTQAFLGEQDVSTGSAMDAEPLAARKNDYRAPADTKQTQLLADQWMDKWENECLHLIGNLPIRRKRRIKIAVLDTYESEASDSADVRESRFKQFGGFVQDIWSTSRDSDEVSEVPDVFGSRTALLAMMAPFAKMYPAPLPKEKPSKKHADALLWAINKEVDIIVINLSLDCFRRKRSESLLRYAVEKNIIVFAAVPPYDFQQHRQNRGLFGEAIEIYSADGYGRPSAFNPPAKEFSENFTVLGEGIYIHKFSKEDQSVSGSSYATIIAAGIAATVLHFASEGRESSEDTNVERKVHTQRGMRLVFRYMNSSRDGKYANITPWKLLSSFDGPEHVYKRLRGIFDDSIGWPKAKDDNREESEYDIGDFSDSEED